MTENDDYEYAYEDADDWYDELVDCRVAGCASFYRRWSLTDHCIPEDVCWSHCTNRAEHDQVAQLKYEAIIMQALEVPEW